MRTILGQSRAVDVINAALTGGRVHHAWIFHGPAGVGKFTTAVRLGRILLCQAPRKDDTGQLEACGECESCHLVDSADSAHPDLHVIRKELAGESDFRSLRNKKQMNIPIDLLRERMLGGDVDGTYVEPRVAKTPMLGHNKVFIIDEAELLAVEGQNALLKTLEEPAAGTYIILVTTRDDRLLPTIRSRCQRVAFTQLDNAVIEQWLAEHGHETLNARQREWVLRFAQGSLGRALLAISYRLDAWYDQLDRMIGKVLAGQSVPELGQAMADLVESFAKAWVDNHANASKDAANKAGVRHMLSLLGDYCRAGVHEVSGRADSIDVTEADAALRPYLVGIELIQEAERQLASNVAPALLLDNLTVQWTVNNQPHLAGR